MSRAASHGTFAPATSRLPVRIEVTAGEPQASAQTTPTGTDQMDLLRLITCGSVDDGKSTLIGRLLYDSKSIHQDQWEAIHRTSLKRGDARVDLALLTDGLRAEREQGITIDVAYRYFSTPRRKFILADTPGHVQYTRNMVTGASTADLAIILIDARQGVLEQTRRHAYLAALLGVSQLVVCINKLDLVGWDRSVFDRIRADFESFTRGVGDTNVFHSINTAFIPASALLGDNLVIMSQQTPWYSGPTLLEHIQDVPIRPARSFNGARFPVQCVIRPQSDAYHDYRGYGGLLAAGTLRIGDEVTALPSGRSSRVSRIHLYQAEIDQCVAGQSVSILLEDDIDLTRGDLLIHKTSGRSDSSPPPVVAREFDATLVWMGEQPLDPTRRYAIKHGTKYHRAIVGPIRERLDIHSLRWSPAGTEGVAKLVLNEIAIVGIRLAAPIAFDPYERCRCTGGFIVIDEASNNTVGAGMIR